MVCDLLAFAGQVFRYGVVTSGCDRNPAAELRDAMKKYIERNMAAVLELCQASSLLRAIDACTCQPVMRGAFTLSPLLFQRPGNTRATQWCHRRSESHQFPAA